jgi:hypothetical protein
MNKVKATEAVSGASQKASCGGDEHGLSRSIRGHQEIHEVKKTEAGDTPKPSGAVMKKDCEENQFSPTQTLLPSRNSG